MKCFLGVQLGCRQATRHNMNRCWPRSSPPFGVNKLEWLQSAFQGSILLNEASNLEIPPLAGLPTVAEFQYFVKEMRLWVREFFWILTQNTEIFGYFSIIIAWKYWNLGKCYWKSWNYSKLLLKQVSIGWQPCIRYCYVKFGEMSLKILKL